MHVWKMRDNRVDLPRIEQRISQAKERRCPIPRAQVEARLRFRAPPKIKL
jgi:hypothetical protein